MVGISSCTRKSLSAQMRTDDAPRVMGMNVDRMPTETLLELMGESLTVVFRSDAGQMSIFDIMLNNTYIPYSF